MLVPLSWAYQPIVFTFTPAFAAAVWNCAAASSCGFRSPVAHERIFSPGARMSGLKRPSPVGPFEEKYETP